MRVLNILIVSALLLISLLGNVREGVSILPSSSAKNADVHFESPRAATPVKIAGYSSSISLDEKESLDTAFGNTIQVTQSSDALWQDVTDFRTMVNGFMNSAEYRLRFGPQQ